MKIIGIMISNDRELGNLPHLVTPVFENNNEYLVQSQNSMLNILMNFLINAKEDMVEAEIDAYAKKEHSVVSSVIDYNDRNDEINFIPASCKYDDDYFTFINESAELEQTDYSQCMIYGVLFDEKLYIGSKDYLLKRLPINPNATIKEIKVTVKVLRSIGAYQELEILLNYCKKVRSEELSGVWDSFLYGRKSYIDKELDDCNKRSYIKAKTNNL